MTVELAKSPSPTPPAEQLLFNNSGQGKGTLPDGVAGWSWGAFWLNWIWAVGNRTWVGLLVFFPVVGFLMSFVLGFKGRAWAWQNKRWDSVEHFNRVQRRWSVWGNGLVLFSFLLWGLVEFLAPQRAPSVDTAASTVATAPVEAAAVDAALDYASGAAQAVGRYVEVARTLPATLQDAGYDAPLPEGVRAAGVDQDTGQLDFTLSGGDLDGLAFHLAPSYDKAGKVVWRCLRGNVPRHLLPRDCRYDTADPFPLAQSAVR